MGKVKRLLSGVLALVFILSLFSSCRQDGRDGYFTERWEIGYGEADIPLDTDNPGQYYVAGYRNDNPATGVLDIPKAKAVWLGAGKNCVLLISVDCVALAGQDIAVIRDGLSALSDKTGCAVWVCATHTHAGVDTLGLWGEIAVNGKNERYMESLYAACASAGNAAFSARKPGKLLYGSGSDGIGDLQEDSREPQVYDKLLHQIRFVPDDGSDGVRIINYAAHAESLRGENSKISADYPAYLAAYIREQTGDCTVFIQGAIGGLIMTRRLSDDSDPGHAELLPVEENCRQTGELLARAALSIDRERELSPSLAAVTQPLSLPVDNDVFVAMKALGILSSDIHVSGEGRHGLTLCTSVGRLTLGDLEIVAVPGEIFPEIVYGGAGTVSEIVGKEFLVFGLCNDEIGYIIPEASFLLNEKRPYIDTVTDSTGENHYEETNSVGKETERLLLLAIAQLFADD